MDSKEYVNLLDENEKRLKEDNLHKWEVLKESLYNFQNGEFFGRDWVSWRRMIAFHIGFYACLVLLYITLLGFFALMGDEIYPMRLGQGSALQEMPGMAIRPVADFESTLIHFIQGKPATYKPHTDHIQTILDQYENEKQVGENFIDCDLGKPEGMEQKVCRFNVDKLGGMCTWQKDFGYDEGQPCVVLKLNKLMEWIPDTYKSSSDIPLDDDNPHDARDRWHPDYIGVSCQGRYDADIENIGNLTYYPTEGFPRFFYPYLNQEGFRSPLVMVRFENPVNGVLINVVCHAWANNITPRHSENDRLGLITFELLVD
eukprot:GHVO01002654.1.p1 GENE.GHVO01002654.1~~GHVO01002654.1.p1  ORF type:complete len:332 (+),score=41.76 GHVO01002654.1:52-996(+)